MRCPQECRLCPEKVLTDDDKRPCGGTQRTGEGGRGAILFGTLSAPLENPGPQRPAAVPGTGWAQAGHRQARLLAEEARGAVALFMIKAWYSNSKTAQILWFLVFVLFCFNFKGKNSRTSLAHLFRVYEADIFFRCFKCWFPKVMGKNVLRYVLDTVSKYFTRINQCDPQSGSVREGRLSSAFYMWGN